MARFSTIILLFIAAQLGFAQAVMRTTVSAPSAANSASVESSSPTSYQKAILREAARWTDYSGLSYENLKEKSLADLIPETASSKYGLTSDEIFAIHAYTEFMSTAVNHALYTNDVKSEETFKSYVSLLKEALKKIPSWSGETTRIAELPPAVLAQHKVGSVVTYHAFTSSSIGGAYGMWSRNTRLVIDGKNGKPIEEFSAEPEEREVIFTPDTRFKVKDRRIIVGPQKQKVTLIHLQEI